MEKAIAFIASKFGDVEYEYVDGSHRIFSFDEKYIKGAKVDMYTFMIEGKRNVVSIPRVRADG